jgi:16S rRNA G966 N2-methylase RsmD
MNHAYDFTNEDIYAYFPNYDFRRKGCLLPAGSGDHALNAVLLGAKNITCYDISESAIKWAKIKIREMSQHETAGEYLKSMYNYYLSDYHFHKCLSMPEVKKANLYLRDENFKNCQEKLKNVNFEYIHSDLLDLPKNEQRYDIVLTSNICTTMGKQKYERFITDDFCKLLKPNATGQIVYEFNSFSAWGMWEGFREKLRKKGIPFRDNSARCYVLDIMN